MSWVIYYGLIIFHWNARKVVIESFPFWQKIQSRNNKLKRIQFYPVVHIPLAKNRRLIASSDLSYIFIEMIDTFQAQIMCRLSWGVVIELCFDTK